MPRQHRYSIRSRRFKRLTPLLAAVALALVLPRVASTAARHAAAAKDAPAGVPAATLAAGAATVASPGAATGLRSEAAAQLVREVRRGRSAPLPYADGASILLANGMRFDPVRDGAPQIDPSQKANPLGAGEMGSFLVQTDGPVQAGWLDAITASGAAVFAYLPNYAFVVRMPAERQAAVSTLPFVRWTGPYHPAYRVSPMAEMSKPSGQGTLYVLLFPDASLESAQTAFQTMGGQILEATDSGLNKLLRVAIDMRHLTELAARNDVAWIEPWHELHVDNSSAQWVVQTFLNNNRRVWDMGLHGEGQVVHTSDSGIRTTHNAFRDTGVPITTFGDYPTHRKIIAYKVALANAGILFGDTSGSSYHGTHTAGTMVGDDSPFSADLRDGMALKAKIYFTDAGASTNSIIAPGDMNLLFQPPYDGNAGGAARISSNSWGSDVAGAYTVQSMTADQFLWNHKDMLISFSNGNAGPGVGTVGEPASFKDGISSGATANGTSAGATASYSARGPAADGRLKPTIMSPGSAVVSASGASDTGYQSLSGTSMSCPTVTGAVTLIRQYLTDGWYPTGAAVPANGFTPSGALVKAMAIASTDNDMTGQQIPNNNVGWGRVKLDNILFFPGDLAHTAIVDQTDGLMTGEFIEYETNVSDASVPLKIALVWYDKEGSPGAVREIVNDLDLKVTDPNSVVYLGNVFSLGSSTTGGSRDSLNVEECVRRSAPPLGVWKVRVTARNVPFGPQPYALAISGGVGTNNALLTLDHTTYGRDAAMKIHVEDANATSPITVQVSSTTESTPEPIAIAGANGVFVGTVFTTADLPGTDGKLSISNGDAIQVTYADANPVLTLHANATASYQGPKITNVFSAPDPGVQRVTWTTDLPSSSRVYYGTTPGLGQSSVLSADLVTAHDQSLSGLAAETTYYFDVESTDRVGNTTRDDNGGAHYRFTTTQPGDILLVIGDDGSFGQTDSYKTAMALRGWNPSILRGGVIGNPLVGNRTAGMRSYTAVWWQVGQEQYPPFEDTARDSLTAYLNGGGRLSVTAHDLAWAFTDPASGYSTPARLAWLEGVLHEHFLADPLTWPTILGINGDPITSAFVGGVPYTPIRSGGAGDEVSIVAGTGTGNFTWINTDASPDNIGIRWENGVPNGNALSALWGGSATKIVNNNYEWSQINSATTRADVLDKTLIWLIGRDHPDVTITSPNGGETITTNNASITWTETTYGGGVIDARSLYYSPDGGSSWTLITAAPGTSPYDWDVSTLPNGASYLVQLRVTDNAVSSVVLRGADASNAKFTIARPGGDTVGPVVVAGSIAANPNPLDNRTTATLNAQVSDVDNGASCVQAAEWSAGVSPAAAGSGLAMTGTFGSPLANVTVTIPSGLLPPGENTIWVRGQDCAGQWGSARAQIFHVNGDPVTDSELRVPARFALHQNAPNPFNPTTAIRFDLPRAGHVDLAIYNVRGALVRRLLSSHQTEGYKNVLWNGRDDAGRPVTSGIYFYKLAAVGFDATRKMVLLK